ncbi:NAD(P)H:quinone oxidoreductase [Paenibacillus agilis]|uniref:NAD(P)H:quinone oxidoreductase n=1 Tax=Paenibacillus agilis TaxID=3020863 RepID=A0A559IGV4_9BACL|nr:NAD(P)H:quinone oxidoreductase [Paenibacillus agilis]
MSNVKLAVIYYSATGTNYQLAEWAKEGAESAGAEVKLFKVQELAPQAAIDANPAWKAHVQSTENVAVVQLTDLECADAIIFSVPTRFGNVAAPFKQFLDMTGGLWFQGKLMNKVVSAMTSAQNPHGGQEATLNSLYTSMYHWGAIVAAPGYTDPSVFLAGGNPYGVSVTVDQNGKMQEDVQQAVKHQAKRTVQIAAWVTQGLQLVQQGQQGQQQTNQQSQGSGQSQSQQQTNQQSQGSGQSQGQQQTSQQPQGSGQSQGQQQTSQQPQGSGQSQGQQQTNQQPQGSGQSQGQQQTSQQPQGSGQSQSQQEQPQFQGQQHLQSQQQQQFQSY